MKPSGSNTLQDIRTITHKRVFEARDTTKNAADDGIQYSMLLQIANDTADDIQALIHAEVEKAVREQQNETRLELSAATYARPDPKWGKNRSYGFEEGLKYVRSAIRAYFDRRLTPPAQKGGK